MRKITGNLSVDNIVSVNFYTGEPARYFFGSLSAIFEAFTPEQVGCSLHDLLNKDKFRGGCVMTSTCVIAKHKLYRKSNKKSRTTKQS
ncbi:MAG: hypothetical protein J6I72_03810 [Muribaculaceae bacterium]|nr:hypothetical protein [Muribaculaceae bacterium]